MSLWGSVLDFFGLSKKPAQPAQAAFDPGFLQNVSTSGAGTRSTDGAGNPADGAGLPAPAPTPSPTPAPPPPSLVGAAPTPVKPPKPPTPDVAAVTRAGDQALRPRHNRESTLGTAGGYAGILDEPDQSTLDNQKRRSILY